MYPHADSRSATNIGTRSATNMPYLLVRTTHKVRTAKRGQRAGSGMEEYRCAYIKFEPLEPLFSSPFSPRAAARLASLSTTYSFHNLSVP
jgi:hypothetical protein